MNIQCVRKIEKSLIYSVINFKEQVGCAPFLSCFS